MNWQNKPISSLTNDELRDAILSVVDIDKNRLDKLDQKRTRHLKIFDKHPPVENNTFIELVKSLNDEFKQRKLTNLFNSDNQENTNV